MIPTITKTVRLNAYDIRKICIKHNLCTVATNDEYYQILDMVDKAKDTTDETIYEIAAAIKKVSEGETIEHIMFLLANEAVKVFYKLNRKGEE